MACCILLASLAAAILWAGRTLLPTRFKPAGSAVAWRPRAIEAQSASSQFSGGFSFRARAKSVSFAIIGLSSVVRNEHNAWVHLTVALAVVLAGLFFQISRDEWISLVLAITLVLAAETLNTSIERLCDVVSPGHNPAIGLVKDMAAGGVLICAIGAFAIGLLIFTPHFVESDFQKILTTSICRNA